MKVKEQNVMELSPYIADGKLVIATRQNEKDFPDLTFDLEELFYDYLQYRINSYGDLDGDYREETIYMVATLRHIAKVLEMEANPMLKPRKLQ